MKPSDVDIVSFEISHASLAMIKLKSNVISFFFYMPCGFLFHITSSAQNKCVARDRITGGAH